MIPPKLPDQENSEIAKRKNVRVMLVVMVMTVLISLIFGVIVLALYFHFFNLANVVNGNG